MKPGMIAGVLVMLAVLITGFTQENWVRLGTRPVDYALDRDVIKVTYREGAFEAIKVVVRGGSLNMHKCVVYFENGGQQEVELRHQFARGSDSRVVDLKGNKRFIDRIEFWYDTKNISGRKAVVSVWGRR